MNVADLTQTVESLQQEIHRLSRMVSALQHPQARIFVASRDSDAGAFTEQIPLDDGSDLQTLTDGRTTVDADTGQTLIRLPAGSTAVLQYPNGDKAAFVDLSSPRGLIPVLVNQAGGANGTQTTAATWTYDVTDVSSTPIASAKSPSWQRAKGKKVKATHGNGYYDPSGNFVLESVDEVDDTGHC